MHVKATQEAELDASSVARPPYLLTRCEVYRMMHRTDKLGSTGLCLIPIHLVIDTSDIGIAEVDRCDFFSYAQERLLTVYLTLD